MFKSGDFSRLARVSVKALRHYDEIGLLKPARVDAFSNYREYSAAQLPRLLRILALKDLGFTLDDIRGLLDGGLEATEVRDMLRQKQMEAARQVENDVARLARVKARLRQIEVEGKMPDYEVVLRKTDSTRVAAVREVIPAYGEVGRLFGEVFAYLSQSGTGPTGAPVAIYYDPEYREQDVDVEVAVPASGALSGNGRVVVRELPEATVASCMHQGSYESIGDAYAALLRWIEANGYPYSSASPTFQTSIINRARGRPLVAPAFSQATSSLSMTRACSRPDSRRSNPSEPSIAAGSERRPRTRWVVPTCRSRCDFRCVAARLSLS